MYGAMIESFSSLCSTHCGDEIGCLVSSTIHWPVIVCVEEEYKPLSFHHFSQKNPIFNGTVNFWFCSIHIETGKSVDLHQNTSHHPAKHESFDLIIVQVYTLSPSLQWHQLPWKPQHVPMATGQGVECWCSQSTRHKHAFDLSLSLSLPPPPCHLRSVHRES